MSETYRFYLQITSPEGQSTRLEIPVGITTLGRQPGNDLLLDHTQVSRAHARIECIADECHLTDLNSSNGTFINDERLDPDVPTQLNDGDTIKIGGFELVFEQVVIETEPEPAPPEPEEEEEEKAEAPPAAEKDKKKAAAKPAKAEKAEDEEKPGKEEKPAAEKAEKKAEKPPEEEEEEEKPVKKKPAPSKKKPRVKAEKEPAPPEKETPPAEPPAPPPEIEPVIPPEGSPAAPGLNIHSRKLLDYLPGIYHTDFMSRFLAIFEATLLPLEWTIDSFDLFLDPDTAPQDFLPWLANLYALTYDSTWSDSQRRALLKEAHILFSRLGTRWALSRMLEIYTGVVPEIDDTGKKLEPFTFQVNIPIKKRGANRELIEALIDANKPAHTSYEVAFTG